MGIRGRQALAVDRIGDVPLPVKRQGGPLCGPQRGGQDGQEQQKGSHLGSGSCPELITAIGGEGEKMQATGFRPIHVSATPSPNAIMG